MTSCKNLPPHSMKPIPAIFKTATRPWLAKASGIAFKKGKKPARQQWLERGMRISERNSPADARVREEKEEVLQVLQHRFPCSPWDGPWWSRYSLAAHGGPC